MKRILIAGAGPTGLTCALELNLCGIKCRIVDKKAGPSALSRAVGINPHSLDLLEASGVTERLLAVGYKMQRLNFRDSKGNVIGAIRADKIPHKYNFILALPQDKTESILSERLQEFGGKVEYGTELVDIELTGDEGVEVKLKNGSETVTEKFDVVIAADGAHSLIRVRLGIEFMGYDYENLWSVSDFVTKNLPYPMDSANLFLNNKGEIGLAIPIGEKRFRAASNTENIFSHLPSAYEVDKVLNGGSFKISVRQAVTYQKGCAFLAGDAAHVHSPAGGRGMNLGIDDAVELAKRIANGTLDGYTSARHPVGRRAIELSERLVRMVSMRGSISKLLRNMGLKIATRFPSLQKAALKQLAGLD